MDRPHATVVAIGSNQCAAVVQQPKGGWRFRFRHQRGLTPARSRMESASASSAAVSAPFARSHARTALSPFRVESQRSAASASVADTVRPSSAASLSSRSKRSAGRDTDRLTTDDTTPWYDHSATSASPDDANHGDTPGNQCTYNCRKTSRSCCPRSFALCQAPAGGGSGTRRSKASPLEPSPRPTVRDAPTHTTARPSTARVRWKDCETTVPARPTSSS